MLATTYLLGYYLGTRVFKLDKDLCMLTAIGSSVCGAAAVLGTDSMLKADSHKVSLAVSTVVLFGTISMFLYPFLAGLGIVPESSFGISVQLYMKSLRLLRLEVLCLRRFVTLP